MKNPVRHFSVPLCLLAVAAATPAEARTAVQGSGTTRAAAMDDANYRAWLAYRARWNAEPRIWPSRLEECARSEGEWVCTAHIPEGNESCTECVEGNFFEILVRRRQY